MEYIEAAEDGAATIARQGGFLKKQRLALKEGLKTLHKKGLYHSDVKPANMLFDIEERLVLIDPMPFRHEALGQIGVRLGQVSDMLAVKRTISLHGDPGRMTMEMNYLANALPIAFNPSHKRYIKHLPYAEEIVKKAGVSREYLKSLGAFRPSQIPTGTGQAIPSGATSESTKDLKAQVKARKNIRREALHKKSIRTATLNGIGAARRHRRNVQGEMTQTLLDELGTTLPS